MQLRKDIEKIQNNVNDFINKYGQEGFLELYFTNLLYEMVKDNIRSKTDSVKNSPGMQYYFDKNGNFEKTSKLKEFDIKLKTECNKKSKQIIELIKKRKETDKIDIAMVEEQSDGWIVRGTCPIDLEGHKWAEGFTVILDLKGKVHHYIGDIRNKELLNSVVEKSKPDMVFHLAAQPIVRLSYKQRFDTFETNIMGTVNILEALRQYIYSVASILPTV